MEDVKMQSRREKTRRWRRQVSETEEEAAERGK